MKNLIYVLMTLVSTVSVAQDRVKQFDLDSDGKVSYVELTQVCTVSRDLFDFADKNSDSYLSNTEMRTGKNYLFDRCKK